MKYFAPELFVRLQDCETPDEFRAVNSEWELAAKRYSARLRDLTPRLTGALRRFVRHGSLHDARVLDIGTAERKATLVVQEDLGQNLLSFTYSLVDAPVFDRDALPDEHRTPHALWLYDELDIDTKMLFNPRLRMKKKARATSASAAGGDDWKPIYAHSILLSNGWEIRLRFHNLAISRTTSLLGVGQVQPQHDLLPTA
jgi:hypothetical protein